jgi:putative redox protein
MIVSKVTYTGQLHTSLHHERSGQLIETDAPPDNNGKGEAFSPTDLLATSLASCMLTVMGIYAEKHGLDISGSMATVDKSMADGPRRVQAIIVDMTVVDRDLGEVHRKRLRDTALNCPVYRSLSENLEKTLNLHFVNG